jgi:hypothetical protein
MGPQATVNIVLGIDTNEHRNNQMRLEVPLVSLRAIGANKNGIRGSLLEETPDWYPS